MREREIKLTKQSFIAIIVGIAAALVLFAGYFFAEVSVFAAQGATLRYETVFVNDSPVANRIVGATKNDGTTVLVPAKADGLPVTEIKFAAFQGRTNLSEINFSNADNLVKIGYFAFKECSGLSGTVELPQSLRELGAAALAECTSVEKVVINDGLISVPYMAFSGDSALKEVVLSDTVRDIGSFAFYGTGIERLVLPTSTIYLDDGALYGAGNLASLEILADEIYFGEHCLDLCTNLKEVVFHSEKAFISATAEDSYLTQAGLAHTAVLYVPSYEEPSQAPDSSYGESYDFVSPDDATATPKAEAERGGTLWLYIALIALGFGVYVSLAVLSAIRIKRQS